jgi:predicted DNA-binding transcriptional regulator AlpA
LPKSVVTFGRNTQLLVPAAEAAKMLSMGRSTFWNKVKLNQVPQPVKIAGITRWRISDLRSFVDVSARTEPAE